MNGYAFVNTFIYRFYYLRLGLSIFAIKIINNLMDR